MFGELDYIRITSPIVVICKHLIRKSLKRTADYTDRIVLYKEKAFSDLRNLYLLRDLR